MDTFKTYMCRKEDQDRQWVIVDASQQILGRLSTKIAHKLRGKDKVDFTPHVDNGDFVIVINAEKIQVTGRKMNDKKYYRHSGYPGGLRETQLKTMLKNSPEHVIYEAVKGMLPKTRLGRAQLKKLKIYAGPEHPHSAQQPKPFEL